MKRILMASAMTVLVLAISTPAMAGHGDHRRGHGRKIARTAGVHVGVYGYPHYTYYRPRASFHLSIGAPFVSYYYAPYYYAPAPVYYSPVPVIVAPAPCGFYVTGHYVWDGRKRVYHKGHRPRGYYEDDEDYDD
jgi:hypothetical protein